MHFVGNLILNMRIILLTIDLAVNCLVSLWDR